MKRRRGAALWDGLRVYLCSLPCRKVLMGDEMSGGIAELVKGQSGSLQSVTSSAIQNFSSRVMGLVPTSNVDLFPALSTFNSDVCDRRVFL